MSGCDEELITTEAPIDDCLQVRKWWCFLLSSIFTFLAGLLIVLLWRAFAFICCRKEPELSPNDPKQKEQKANRGKQEFEGTFMTEAKDWAGELISGQTTTGRILVSILCDLLKLNYMTMHLRRAFLCASWPSADVQCGTFLLLIFNLLAPFRTSCIIEI